MAGAKSGSVIVVPERRQLTRFPSAACSFAGPTVKVGKPVPRDDGEAVKWLRMVARQGNYFSMCQLNQ